MLHQFSFYSLTVINILQQYYFDMNFLHESMANDFLNLLREEVV